MYFPPNLVNILPKLKLSSPSMSDHMWVLMAPAVTVKQATAGVDSLLPLRKMRLLY